MKIVTVPSHNPSDLLEMATGAIEDEHEVSIDVRVGRWSDRGLLHRWWRQGNVPRSLGCHANRLIIGLG